MDATDANRPRSISITLAGLLLLSLWNAGRVFALWRQISLLLALSVQPDPRFQLLMACVWMVLHGGAAVALWRKRPFTRGAIPLLLTLYALYEATLLALYVRVPVSGADWLLRIALAISAVLFAHWALNRAAARQYFAED